jgi:hypothetical protein
MATTGARGGMPMEEAGLVQVAGSFEAFAAAIGGTAGA